MKNNNWQLVNPEGGLELKSFGVMPHHQSLENKRVLLHWNSKHNGDLFLNKIGELLTQKVKGVEIIRGWQIAPETATISLNPKASKQTAKKLAEFRPDIVIGAQCD